MLLPPPPMVPAATPAGTRSSIPVHAGLVSWEALLVAIIAAALAIVLTLAATYVASSRRRLSWSRS